MSSSVTLNLPIPEAQFLSIRVLHLVPLEGDSYKLPGEQYDTSTQLHADPVMLSILDTGAPIVLSLSAGFLLSHLQ